MGLFYINHNVQERKEFNKKHEKDLKEIAKETMELVANAPKEVFPDFVWEPQINEFENTVEYRIKAACKNPSVLRAYNLGRKYSNYWDYVDALNTYYEYTKFIDAVFGSFDMMAAASREGYGSVFIPPYPKLAHKKKNKVLMRTGFMPSKVDDEYEMEDEAIDSSINNIEERELDLSEDSKLPKILRKLQKAMEKSKERSDRVANVLQYSSSNHQGMDAIIAFLSSTSGDIPSNERGVKSLVEEIEDLHLYDGIDPVIVEDLRIPKQGAIIRDGYLQNQKEAEKAEIIKTLETNGFDFLSSSATKGMKPEAVRALRRQFNEDVDLSTMTKKQRKKYKKKMRRKMQEKRDAQIGDQRITQTLLKNRIHLNLREGEEYGVNSDLVNFHLSDVFKDYDD